MARSIQHVGLELKKQPSFCRRHLVRRSRLVRGPGHHTFLGFKRRLNEKRQVGIETGREKENPNIPFFGPLTGNILDDTLDSFAFDTLLILVMFENHFRANHELTTTLRNGAFSALCPFLNFDSHIVLDFAAFAALASLSA